MNKPCKHSVFYRWIISYVLIVVMSVGLCAWIAVNARELLMEEYLAGSTSVRTLSSRLLDTYLDNIYARQQQYIQSDALSQFIACEPPYSGADLYWLVNLKRQLHEYSVYSPDNGSEAYIYLKTLEKGIDARSIYDINLLKDVFHSDLTVDTGEICKSLNGYHGYDFVIMPTTNDGVSVMLMSSVPNSSLYDPQATVVQKLDGEFFTELLRNSTMQMGMYMYLVDSRGYVISSNGPKELMEEMLENAILYNSMPRNVTLGGEDYLVSVDSSTISKWYYVTMISPVVLSDKVASLNRMAVIVCLFCLFAGATLSYMLARWQYRPMANVLNRLSGQLHQSDTGNEYDMILSAFDNIGASHRNIDRLWRQQTLILQQEFLSSALLGNISGDTARMAQTLDIPISGYGYCVLLLSAYGADSPESVEGMLDAAASRCAGMALNWNARVYSLDIREPRALALMLEQEGAVQCHERICADVLDIVTYEKWDAKLLAALSPITYDINTLNLCYLDANYMLDEKRKLKHDSCPLPQALNVANLYRLDYSDHAATAICMAVRNGNAQEAADRLEQMTSNCPERVEPAQHMVLTRLLADVLANIPSACRKEAQYARLPDRLALRMRNTSSLEEIKQILYGCIRKVSDACAQERKSSLISSILSCVDEHYAQLDFNVSKVAQMMDMNMSYLSQYFRDQSGIGLLEYINRVRISHAKALIQNDEQGLTITQVARQVGFDNLNSFIRVFKKYEGVTPGEYRKYENSDIGG